MSKLYGYLEGDSGGRQTKSSNRVISSTVQTQRARITVTLNAAGDYHIGDSYSDGHHSSGYHGGREIASGNLHGGQSRTRASRRGGGRYREADRGSESVVPVALGLAALGTLLFVLTRDDDDERHAGDCGCGQ